MAESPLKHLDQLLHTVERGRALNVDNEGRLPVRLYGPDGQPLFTEQNPAHVKGEVTLTGSIVDAIPLVESESIRDGDERVARLSSAGINPREYARFDYYIRNRLQTDVFVGFGRTIGDPMSVPLLDGGKGFYGARADRVTHVVPHTGHVPWPLSWLPLTEEHKAVDPLPYQRLILNLSANVDLLFRPASAPTTGDISIWFVGWRA